MKEYYFKNYLLILFLKKSNNEMTKIFTFFFLRFKRAPLK